MPPANDDTPITPQGSPSHRPASVTLRSDRAVEAGGAGLDPANQSLAEALQLIFRLLQGAMVLLVVAFCFSGLQLVNQNQRGIKLLFGKKVAENLYSGPHFSAPYPLGEMVKVDVGNVSLSLDEAFWPRLTAEQKAMSPAMVPKASLKPGEDGALVTGDENLAHTKWLVNYTRARPGDYAENMLPEDERKIVEAAVQRGVVHAAAQVSVDELLKQSATDQGSVAVRAREIAQQTLDAMSSGVRIEQLTLQDRVPPFVIINEFAKVQSAEQNAGKLREEAETAARNTLNEMAGGAHQRITEKISAYEDALARGDAAAQDRIIAEIDALLQGRDSEAGSLRSGVVSGRVANMLNEARQYRSSIVSQREAELALFKAKLAQYRSNPDLVVQREWADAMSEFLAQPLVEIFNVPAGSGVTQIWLNRDPDFVKAAETAAKEDRVRRADEKRRNEQMNEVFKTRTGATELRDR